MLKRSSIFGMNILAVLPFASDASFAVWAATIVLATKIRTATKYFRTLCDGYNWELHKDRDRHPWKVWRSPVRNSQGQGDIDCSFDKYCSSGAIQSDR